MDVPEEVMQQLQGIQSALDDVEEHMQPFLEAGPKEITAQLTPLERLKAHLALAQAAVVLFTLDRQLDAAKLDKHPVQKELERLAKYERKVQEAVVADDLARTKPGTSLNIAAANRFIDAAIPDLSLEQKAALRGLHKRPAADAAAVDDDDDEHDLAEGAGNRSKGSGKQGSRGRSAKRQQQQRQWGDTQSKQQQRPGGAATAQEFIQDLVAEVAQQEQQQQGQQQQQQQQPGSVGAARNDGHQLEASEQAAPAAVDADAFLQDIMASLDKQE